MIEMLKAILNSATYFPTPLTYSITPSPWIKLADFGLATRRTKCEGLAGTFSYVAPEAYGSGSNDSKGDIWSGGVVATQLLLKGILPDPSTRNVHGPAWCGETLHEAGKNN